MSNLFEKACNDVNDKLIISTVVPAMAAGANTLASVGESGSSSIKTNYIIFGYEMSLATLIIIGVCLAIVVYMIYSYFFNSKPNVVNVKKFELTDTESESENEDDKTNEEIQDEEELDK